MESTAVKGMPRVRTWPWRTSTKLRLGGAFARRFWLSMAASSIMALGFAASASAEPEPVRGVSYGPNPADLMTIFPAAVAGSPTVILVHGGSWHQQTREAEEEGPALGLQHAGFAVFDLNFPQRPTKGVAFPLEVEAIEAGTQFAIANGETYNANPGYVTLLGGSSGGQLVGMAAEHLDVVTPGLVAKVISLSGLESFPQAIEEKARGELAGKIKQAVKTALDCPHGLETCSLSFAEEWSPIDHIPEASCPSWLLAGSAKDLIKIAQQRSFQTALSAAGCHVELFEAPKSHSFGYWAHVASTIVRFIGEGPVKAKFTIEKEQEIEGSKAGYTKSKLTGERGQTVDYKVVVKNTGNVSLKFGELTDSGCEGISPSGEDTIAAGGEEIYTCRHELTTTGVYSNEATIEGNEGAGSETSNMVEVEVPAPEE
jgi:acetyl esterase/lipase